MPPRISHRAAWRDDEDRRGSRASLSSADIVSHFTQAIGVFPTNDETRRILRAADQSWQQSLIDAGLWGNQALSMTGRHLEENPIFGAASDAARAMLDDLDAPSLRAMRQGLVDGRRLERYMIILLIGLGAIGPVLRPRVPGRSQPTGRRAPARAGQVAP
jgi:hypothetical protein